MDICYEVTCVKPYSTKELSKIYGVCDRTFSKWLQPFIDEIGERRGRYFTVLQVEIIFKCLGMPYFLKGE